VVVTGDQVEHSKPHPEIFLRAMELSGVSIEMPRHFSIDPALLTWALLSSVVVCTFIFSLSLFLFH